MTSKQLRVLVLTGNSLQASGTAAALASAVEFVPVTRSLDVLRVIGASPDVDSRRRSAVAAAADSEVVIVVLDDEVVRLDERALATGIETLADAGVPIVLLLGLGNEGPMELARAARWTRRQVRGVLSIDAPAVELTAAVRAVSAGLVVLEPRIADALAVARSGGMVPERRTNEPRGSAQRVQSVVPLSAREREVLALLAEGHATKTIARDLGISSHTVKAHVESIFEKFGATTRAEAVAIGIRRGAVML